MPNRIPSPTAGLLSERSRPQLMIKLRRIGGFMALFTLLVLASVHWITQDIQDALTLKLPKAALVARVTEAADRLDLILVVAGVALVPLIGVAMVLAARFVRAHFEELETANRRKSQYVSMVVHELRTPLNGIKGFADILASAVHGSLNPGQDECVREIRGGVRHMKTMISDLLDQAKIEAGTIELKLEETDFDGILREAVATAGPTAKERGLRLAWEGALAADVRVDFSRTKQILLNLLSNAFKYSPDGGTVTVRAETAGPLLRIAVIDEGPGIALEGQAALFEEFRQVTPAPAGLEGTGLGLAICRKLVEKQGGTIWIESAPGAGSRFCFTVPLASASAKPAVFPAPAGFAAAAEGPRP